MNRYLLLATAVVSALLLLNIDLPQATPNSPAPAAQAQAPQTVLESIHYLPVVLPLIIDNRDVIGLTDSQVEKLLDWRAANREHVLATINQIIAKRASLKQVALSPAVSDEEVAARQTEIFELQRKVLDYKLSCRTLVFDMFNEENWEGLMFVLAEALRHDSLAAWLGASAAAVAFVLPVTIISHSSPAALIASDR